MKYLFNFLFNKHIVNKCKQKYLLMSKFVRLLSQHPCVLDTSQVHIILSLFLYNQYHAHLEWFHFAFM